MTREQCVQALDTLCEAMNSCDNCPIAKSYYGREYCLNHEFKDMAVEDLVLYAQVVGFNYDGSDSEPDLESEKTETVKEDLVNHPNHYTSGGIECIDAIEASMTPIEYAGFLKGQVLKYAWRYRLKGNLVQDLKKASFYLDRLIRVIENEEVTA